MHTIANCSNTTRRARREHSNMQQLLKRLLLSRAVLSLILAIRHYVVSFSFTPSPSSNAAVGAVGDVRQAHQKADEQNQVPQLELLHKYIRQCV